MNNKKTIDPTVGELVIIVPKQRINGKNLQCKRIFF